MRNALIFILYVSVLFFSCKRSNKQLIIGKWHAVKLENPGMDSFFSNSQAYIDTIGKNNDSATNFALYGAVNMDSMRQLLQQQYDSAKNMQTNSVLNTTFNFRDDGIVILSFNGSRDSSKWKFDNKNQLILTDLNKNDSGVLNQAVTMQVLSLSDTDLQLKFEENNSFSTVTFHPDGK